MIKHLLKLFFAFAFLVVIFFLQNTNAYAQTCGGSGQCGTYTTTCTLSDGTTPCLEGTFGCTCTSSCNLTTSTYSCSYNTIISACTPNYPSAVPECSAGGCAQNNCTGPTYPNCNGGASCGPWTVECGSASRTCTYTTYTGGGTCTQNNFTDTDIIACPTGEYCSTNTCYAYRDITGTVYVDSNRDGVAESNKSGVSIARTGGSTTTNASGNYAFNNLTQGTYTVSMTVPSGYVVKPGTQTAYSVVATTSDKVQNFWISDESDITGKVVIDYNHNGIYDTDYNNNGSGNDSDVYFDSAGSPISLSGGPTSKANVGTDANGDYSFNTLLWGNYTVTLNVPANYAIVNTNPKTVALGQNNVTVNFFITPTYSITAHVGEDLDNTPNTNVNNYSGAKIDLLSGGVQVDTCTTVASGSCNFTGLISKLYRVRLNLPAGYEGRLPTPPYDCTPNSCIGGAYTVTQDMPASSTTTDETVNFVMTKLYDITGGVYRDTNGGARSADVIYSNGTNVALRQGGTTLANDNAGTFAFNDNRPGTYTLVMSVPATYEGVQGANETCIPSSGNCTTSVTYDTFNIGPNASHNFVIESAQLCSVTGSVTTTTGTDVQGIQLNLSGDATATDTSNSAGDFSFGPYQDGTSLTVTLATNTLPAGYTIANGGAARPAGVCPDSVVNYILNAPASAFDISGHVFTDNNEDGLRNGADSDMSGVTVALVSGPTSKPSVQSGSGAINPYNYIFQGLAGGNYTVRITVPAGYKATNGNCSASNPNCTGTTSIPVSIGPDETGVNFGLAPLDITCNALCCFRGTVRVDSDLDGLSDRAFGGGTTVNLRFGGPPPIGTDTTGQGGKYSINTNTARTYRVQLDVPAGYVAASTNPVTNLACTGPNQLIETDFLIQPPGCTISGNIYTDRNGNGVRDGGESGISGTTVTIKRGSTVLDSPTTNVAGSFSSTQPTGYSYTVSVPQPADTAVSTPPNPRTVTVCPDATANFGFTPIPKGNLDQAICTNFGGWTCDASDYNAALTVHFYADGPAGGGGTLIGSTVANASRGDLGGVCGGVLTHAFNYPTIPASLKDGQNHTIYAYGIDTPTAVYNPLLGGSPKTINCQPAGSIVSVPPTCNIPPDDADGLCGVIVNWSCEGPSCGVCVSTPGSGESVFASGASGVPHSSSAPWINATDPYTFVLRSPLNSCTGPEIGRIVVSATKTYMISGAVYVDSNGNGAKDAGESNYTGAQITVRNSSGTIVSSPTTSGAGVTNYATYPPTLLSGGGALYSVTLTVPVGYAVTTPNPKTLTLGPNGSAYFGIRPSYTVTTTALVDTNLDNCATGATNYTATLISFLLTDQTLGTSSNSGPQNDGTHTFSNVLLNPQQASFSVPTGYRISGITGAPVAGSRVGNSLNFTPTGNQTVNFCITDAVAWFQTNQGDVRYPRIINKVPVGLAAGTSGNSVFISSSSTANFGQGGTTVGDKNKWKINNEYTTFNSGAKNALGSFSYDFYKNRAAKNNIGITLLSAADAQCVDGNCTLPALATGVYEFNGDLIIDGSAAQTNHVVILVNGSVTITGDILTSGNGLFILAAKQGLTIDKAVGTTTLSSLAPQLSGFFSAQNSIVIDGDGTAACSGGPGDARLNVEGALIANSLYPFADNSAGGKIQNNRSLCSSDDTYPAFYVAMKPEFFTKLTDFYKVTNKRWMQVQP